MIRFRLGQRWKRENAGAPHDSLGVEVDGLDLLGGEASEEPLADVIPDLVSAVHALWAEGEAVAQVSLPEAHLELALVRQESDVDLAVVSLGRPARLARRTSLELPELAQAASRCGRAMLADLGSAAPAIARCQATRRMETQLASLDGAGPAPLRRPFAQGGFGYRRFAVEPVAFGFELLDGGDRLLTLSRRGRGALPSLLCDGSVWLGVQREEIWRAQGAPFLLSLELTRQAADLTHALDLGDRCFSFVPGGAGGRLELHLAEGTLEAGERQVAVDPHALVRAMYAMGLELSLAATVRNKAQAENPYLVELTARCREGLSHLRPAAEPEVGPPAVQRQRASAARPLTRAGRVRRLRFEPLWERQGLGDEEPGTLLLGGRGPIVAAPRMASAFSASGEPIFRRTAEHGVAVSREGLVLCANTDRLLCFRGPEASARWIRDHDGLPVGPLLLRRQGLLLTTSEARTALACNEVTGREVWRVAPVRIRYLFVAVQAHRALLAADTGYLLGLDLQDGQARYRVRATLPFLGPTVPWGRHWVAALGSKERCALVVTDAHSGGMRWSAELPLAMPSQPLAVAGRVAVAGEREGVGLLACYGPKGTLAWERTLHLGHGPYRLLAVGRGILAVSSTGAATLIEPNGEVRWHLGAAGEPVARPLSPASARGVLVLPGERVRAVDPRSGRVLAEVSASPGLCDLKVDSRLNLYLLDEHGTLEAYRLSTHLTVVGA